MKKIKRFFFIFVVIVALVVSFIVPIIAILGVTIEKEAEYSLLEAVYYVSSSFMAGLTLIAIMIALFGDEFKRFFYKADCDIVLSPQSFAEKLDYVSPGEPLVASNYYCNLSITNTSGTVLKDCKLKVDEVQYRIDQSKKYKNLGLRNNGYLYWWQVDNDCIDIKIQESVKIPIVFIQPETSEATPDGHGKILPLRLSIIGAKNEKSKGEWRVIYSLWTSTEIVKRVAVDIWWSGKWENRYSEMQEETKIALHSYDKNIDAKKKSRGNQ